MCAIDCSGLDKKRPRSPAYGETMTKHLSIMGFIFILECLIFVLFFFQFRIFIIVSFTHNSASVLSLLIGEQGQ